VTHLKGFLELQNIITQSRAHMKTRGSMKHRPTGPA